jgi:hypothetical protein
MDEDIFWPAVFASDHRDDDDAQAATRSDAAGHAHC